MRDLLSAVNGVLYYPILIIVLLACGFYFTIRTKFIQFGLLGEAFKVISEKPEGKDDVSSFQALGGPGAVFWMWIIALIGGASAFIESTLAQIYKKRGSDGVSYGGPSYYIENAIGSRGLGVLFAVALIATYAVGFNMLASFNLQDSFRVYDFYVPGKTSWMIGAVLALIAGYCILGGGKRIIKFTSLLVPVMGVIFVIMAIIMIVINAKNIPSMFGMIFEDAFNFKAIFGGVAGSCLVQGIKRGLYSNEAGMGSAPNAAASASVSHPVKQGLVQMISVFLDTIVICSATAFMSLASGIAPTEELAGAPFVQASLSTVFGSYGNLFITVSLALFAFTTLLGNLYYVDSCLTYLNKKTPSKTFMLCYRIIATILIFVGAGMEMSLAWDVADLLMGIMCLINIPSIIYLGSVALKALEDYKKQRSEGKNPVFKAETIGIDTSKLDYWK